MICLIIYHYVTNYDYDCDLIVSIMTISGLLTVDAQISMNTHHYCVNYCVYSTVIDCHHETMDHCHLHHCHQAHHSILTVDYLGHLVRELGHILIKSHRYLAVCHSDQI